MRAGAHSIFSPSGSKMWLTCSGSLIPNILAKDDAGVDAAYGTVAHGLTEQALLTGVLPKYRIGGNEFIESGDWGFLIEIDDDMMGFVRDAFDYCDFLPGDHLVEQRVYFSRLTPIPDQSGTADHIAMQPGKMIITDHKFGKGIVVYAKRNPQAMLYALGALYEHDHKYNFKTILIRISQPRLNHYDEWECSREELLEFAEYVKVRAKAAWVHDAPRTPSADGCLWCKVKADCGAYVKMQHDLMSAAFDDVGNEVTVAEVLQLKENIEFGQTLNPADPMRLSTDDLAFLYAQRGMAERWWKALGIELHRRALSGENVPGWKLVESRSRRAFRSRDITVSRMVGLGVSRSDLLVETLASPAEVEKLLKKAGHRNKDLPELLDGLIYKPPGKPTLASVVDKRPALEDLSGIAFADLDIEPEDSYSTEEI